MAVLHDERVMLVVDGCINTSVLLLVNFLEPISQVWPTAVLRSSWIHLRPINTHPLFYAVVTLLKSGRKSRNVIPNQK